MLIEISIGEALDRLTILELKMEKINDQKKLEEVQKDINTLFEVQKYKIEGEYYYKLLFYVNKEIWNLTDRIKQLYYTNDEFAKLTHFVFELNQSRFRLKNIINKIYESKINEQKSYNLTEIQFKINDSSLLEPATLLNQLSYISLQYDILKISCSDTVKDHIIKNVPRFNYTFQETSESLVSIDQIDLLVNSITQ